MNTRKSYRIGQVTELLGISADTLRYYERLGLLAPVQRSPAGIRLYAGPDLSRLRFIQRAKSMNFSLSEIAQLLEMRADPQHARVEVRELTRHKLQEVKAHLDQLNTLHNELSLLLNLCMGSEDGCPIIEDLDKTGPA